MSEVLVHADRVADDGSEKSTCHSRIKLIKCFGDFSVEVSKKERD